MYKPLLMATIGILLTGCDGSSGDSANNGSTGGTNEPTPRQETSLIISWMAPEQDIENNDLDASEIEGFSIHYGSESGKYTSSIYVSSPEDTSYILSKLPEGEYYFAMKAVSKIGGESDFSDEYYINTEL